MPPLAPRDPVVAAARLHDAGWIERDERPRLDPGAGRPFTYVTRPPAEGLEVAERSVARVASADPYAGWLVSRHFASFLEGSDEPDAIGWVVEQVGRRAELLARARARVGTDALHPHVLEANLDRLQLLDALSLALCEGWEGWESRPMAAGYGEERATWRWVPSGEPATLAVEGTVDPWPFAEPVVAAAVPARLLGGLEWESEASLARAWEEGEEVRVEATLRRE